MKVLIREEACADLERICAWIAQDNLLSAASVATRIFEAIDSKIALFPYIGRIGKVDGTHEWVVRGLPYIIVYTVDDARELITILGVFHGAQDR
ncbi:MAG TPA: type II toxin-antitoxin system RelE/ParE family toxin [Rhizomicrobium sp.]|nr:type II toxin-antitoxin system RelE/ParE family toxin [Rhizomicrobium sp.]